MVLFVYDGTNYVMEGEGIASTSFYGVTKLIDSVSSTSTTTSATPNSVKTAYDLANTKLGATDIADNLTTNDNTKVLSAKQGKWLKDNTASASHDHAIISGGVSGAPIFNDTDGVGMYALGNRIIYDWHDSDLVYYDRDGMGITEDNEIATKGDISNAIGDAITYINQ